MRSAKTIASLVLAAAALSGCASTGPLTATSNPSLYSVHQPVVQRTDFVLDLDASGDILSPGERDRLIAWFESIELRYGDRIFVEEPRDYPSPGARAGVAGVLGEYGMLLQPGAPVVTGQTVPGTVRVIASRATASVPDCPNWGDQQIVPSVNTSANFGCAVNSNLAAIIADPNDLLRGRSGSAEGSGSTAARAVRVYRDRTPTGAQPLQQTSTTGGSGN
jgi:pilus assembly protein CpaD